MIIIKRQIPVKNPHRPAGRRSALTACLLPALALVLAGALPACSRNHLQPYIRADLAAPSSRKTCSPAATVEHRLLLIGDAGAPREQGVEPALAGLAEWAGEFPGRTTILFLGDNVYSDGFKPRADAALRRDAERRADALLATVKSSGARAVFIAGNHDWSFGRSGLCAQSQYFTTGEVKPLYLPSPCGCPGPAELDLGSLRLILIDTTWLRKESALTSQAKDCDTDSLDSVMRKLKERLDADDRRPVVVAGHHGIRSYGSHGQFYEWDEHLLPIPILGTIGVLLHSTLGCALDACGPLESRIVKALRSAMAANPPLAYAAGHDHSLQVLSGREFAELLLVSGGGSAEVIGEAGDGSDTLFAQSASGFMVLDVLDSGEVNLQVITSRERAGAAGNRLEHRLAWAHCMPIR